MSVEIRQADEADSDEIAALDRWAAWLRTFYRDGDERFDRRLWHAELDGEVVGTALIGPPRDYLGPWVGQLYELHVHPDHRRKGVGSALHATCLAAWRAAGVTVGMLELPSHDEPTRSFYESHGWLPDGHTRQGFGDTTYLRLRRTIN